MNYDLTKLTRDQLVAMLEEQGYSSSDITKAEFNSCSNGQVKYRIEYYDIEDELCDSYVYIFINYQGKLIAEF